MLFKTSQNQQKIRENLLAICGNTYTLAQKIKNGIYGSPKYLLLKISPKNFEIDFDNEMLKHALAHSNVSLGNGIVNDIKDIIFVDPKKLDRQKSIEIANSISRINASMIDENRPYLLIGPGRWGSSDNLLGIPVKWGQISGARTIIECELADISVDPSQGTHFFQNIV